jgi:hypothetical protein
MVITRRNAILSTLFGSGYIGLRSLATGIPAGILLGGPKALAATPGNCTASNAQYVIMSTSDGGDPISCNAPGTYGTVNGVDLTTALAHPTGATMAATALTINGTATTAAQPWSTPSAGGQLQQTTLDRMSLWHMQTNTPIHPAESRVLGLYGATMPNEMLPSLMAEALQSCLGTVQPQPIALGAAGPSEQLTFKGQPLPIIPPLALKATLTSPTAKALLGLNSLQSLRDSTLATVEQIYNNAGTPAQQQFIESMILSQQQLRSLNQTLIDGIADLPDNTVASQVKAAIILIQLKVSAVYTIHIAFGGDNHNDANLTTESQQTVSGLQSLQGLMGSLASNNGANGQVLTDQVSVISLNVFGRTMAAANNMNGRGHNEYHHLGMAIGKPFNGGIIGGVQAVGTDFGCMAIDPSNGAGVPSASATASDVATTATLASFGATVMTGVGIDSTYIQSMIPGATIVTAALAS